MIDFKEYKNWILGGLAVLCGLLLLIAPSFCIKIVVVILGISAVVDGFYNFLYERTLIDDKVYQSTILGKSIGSIVIGILSVAMPLAVAGTAWKVMTYLLAVFLLISGGIGFFAMTRLKENEINVKQLRLENIVCLGAAVLLLIIGPDKLGLVFVRIIGAAALIFGIVFLIMEQTNGKDLFKKKIFPGKKSEIVTDENE